jgi:hypothetical protein
MPQDYEVSALADVLAGIGDSIARARGSGLGRKGGS